jgi:hypothetical protein
MDHGRWCWCSSMKRFHSLEVCRFQIVFKRVRLRVFIRFYVTASEERAPECDSFVYLTKFSSITAQFVLYMSGFANYLKN